MPVLTFLQQLRANKSAEVFAGQVTIVMPLPADANPHESIAQYASSSARILDWVLTVGTDEGRIQQFETVGYTREVSWPLHDDYVYSLSSGSLKVDNLATLGQSMASFELPPLNEVRECTPDWGPPIAD